MKKERIKAVMELINAAKDEVEEMNKKTDQVYFDMLNKIDLDEEMNDDVVNYMFDYVYNGSDYSDKIEYLLSKIET